MSARPSGCFASIHAGSVCPVGRRSRGRCRVTVEVQPLQGRFQVGDQRVERPTSVSPRGRSARNPGPRRAWAEHPFGGGPQAATDPVALHRVADLAAGREADPHERRRLRRPTGRPAGVAPARSSRASPTAARCRRRAGIPAAASGEGPQVDMAASSRKALASLGPAAGEDPTAADGCHARPEAVPALADKIARLISAFHGVISDQKPARCIRTRAAEVNAGGKGRRPAGTGGRRSRAGVTSQFTGPVRRCRPPYPGPAGQMRGTPGIDFSGRAGDGQP